MPLVQDQVIEPVRFVTSLLKKCDTMSWYDVNNGFSDESGRGALKLLCLLLTLSMRSQGRISCAPTDSKSKDDESRISGICQPLEAASYQQSLCLQCLT